MKKLIILLLFISQSLYSQHIMRIGDSFTEKAYLTIVDSSNVSFNLTTTKIKVSSDVPWKLIYGADSSYLTSGNNQLEINNIAFTLIDSDDFDDNYNYATDNGTELSALQTYPRNLIEPIGKESNDGEYLITLNWIYGTAINSARVPMYNAKLSEQSLISGIYSVNIIFQIVPK